MTPTNGMPKVFASLGIDERGFNRSFHGQRPFMLRGEGQVRRQQVADLLSHGLLLLDRLKRDFLFVDQAAHDSSSFVVTWLVSRVTPSCRWR